MTTFLKRCQLPLLILLVSAAIISSLFRALTPWATQYKQDLETRLSEVLGEPVHIKTMETGWYWFDPVINLKEVSVGNEQQNPLQLKKLSVGINIFSSLWNWQIKPGVLYIDDLHMTLRQQENGWQVDGLRQDSSKALSAEDLKPILSWMLSQRKIIIQHLSSDIILQNGRVIPLETLSVSINQHAGHYRIRGEANLAQKDASSMEVVADFHMQNQDWRNVTGETFIGLHDIQFQQWQSLLPFKRIQAIDGQGSVQLWLDWQEGQVTNAQALIEGKQVSWEDTLKRQDQHIQTIKANLAWTKNAKGWQLEGDHVLLRINGYMWPENNFSVKYLKNTQMYQTFVKHIMLSSLIHNMEKWFDTYPEVFKAHPVGHLTDTQFYMVKDKLSYMLSRFDDVSWHAQENWPNVTNLSGVLYWQPEEGHLELDSENVTVKPQNRPPIQLEMLNAAIDWKTFSHGLRVSMDRMVIKNPDIVISAHGAADEVTRESAQQVDLNLELSGKNAQQWLQYIPSGKLKHKLELWLKTDIKHIGSISAEMNLHGKWADFPFDTTEGEFTVRSHLQDVDVICAPNWPLTRDIEAYLSIDKRNLSADIVHANLQGILLDNANLRIDDIGHDKETLLIHAKADSDAYLTMAYVMASPLAKKLSALNRITMQGPISMDLKLEAPLYPENDDILALGDISFNQDKVKINHALGDMELHDLKGTLQFDQNGILDSNFDALLMEYPVSMYIRSVRQPTPYVQIKLKGQTSIALIREKIASPLLSLLKGDLWLTSTLMLTDDPGDLDHIQIKSSLSGVRIDLPAPLGKQASEKLPLVVDVDFNPDKALRFRIDYADRLNGDLWFTGSKGNFQLQKGQIRVGDDIVAKQPQEGVQLIAALPDLNLLAWQQTFARLPKGESQFAEALTLVNLSIKKAQIAGHEYDNLLLNAQRLPTRDWEIKLNQTNMHANLRYDQQLNRLTGVIDKLALQGKLATEGAVEPTLQSNYQVHNMPNLELKITDLRLNDLILGQAHLQMSTNENQWKLDDFQLQSESYTLRAQGKWQQDNQQSETHIQAQMKITDLSKTLQQWHITPVVESKKGTIDFEGGWPGNFTDFSIKNMKGDMAMRFKYGRITHFDKDVEEKLGLGKLLSILSLQTIPRRLTLDFSDLANTGYSFDTFDGHFKIAHGMMSTLDTYIDGPVAYASMKGNLDIARQLYNLDLQISPHITASLPIVATIAGGPIAGIATWVASKIINRGMEKISGYTYKITGPWKQPVVQQVSIIKHQKT